MGLVILLLLGFLIITGWVAYYISSSVYKSLKSNHNKNARLIQVILFLVVFAGLTALGFMLLLENVRLER